MDVTTSEVLNFEVTSDELELTVISESLNFISTEDDLELTTTSDALNLELKTYTGEFPIFQVVLDFIDVMGGIY